MGVGNILDRLMFREMEHRLHTADEANRIEGIPLVDYDLYTPYFRQTFAAALKGLKAKDPRRFRRICQYIKGIVALPIGHVQAGYIEQLQVCAVRFEPPPSKEKLPKWAIWYASILVHEATHGLIHARGIPYDEQHRERIERLCYKEENRFFKRIGVKPESLAKLEKLKSFDSKAYQRLWASSFWSRWRQSVRYQRARRQHEKEVQDSAEGKA
jgi:hypothetical protein